MTQYYQLYDRWKLRIAAFTEGSLLCRAAEEETAEAELMELHQSMEALVDTVPEWN